jgi:hypothetical protein
MQHNYFSPPRFILEALEPRHFLSSAYTITDLGTGILANDVNNSGVVVGCTDGFEQSFVWSRERGMQDLSMDFGNHCALMINDRGQIAGDQDIDQYGNQGFLISGSRVQYIPGTFLDLNDNGTVLSSIQDYGDPGNGTRYDIFLFDGSKLTDVATTDDNWSLSLTNSDQIVQANAWASLDAPPGSPSHLYVPSSAQNFIRNLNWDKQMSVSKEGVAVVPAVLEDRILFLIENGKSARLVQTPPIHADFLSIEDVSNSGMFLVDFASDASGGELREYLFDGIAFRDISALISPNSGWSDIYVSALNDLGDLVGFASRGDDQPAILMSPNSGARSLPLGPTDLPALIILPNSVPQAGPATSISNEPNSADTSASDPANLDSDDPLSMLNEDVDIYA